MNWLKRKLQRLSPPKPPVINNAAREIGLHPAPEGTFWRILEADAVGDAPILLVDAATGATLSSGYIWKAKFQAGEEAVATFLAWKSKDMAKEYMDKKASTDSFERLKDCLAGDYR